MARQAHRFSSEKTLIPPGSTIGILGGGQLGRMLAIAAAEMGYHVHIFCPDENSPASEVARETTIAPYEDFDALKRFGESVNVITYEFENIPAAPIAALAAKAPVYPSPEVLALCQHRVREKQALNKLGIATAKFAAVASRNELDDAVKITGLPAVLKTAKMGYDGKGQISVSENSNLTTAWKHIDAEAILEAFVDFKMEISVIAARDAKGNMVCYPAVQNIHRHHMLAETIAPANISNKLAKKADAIAREIAKGIDLIGLMAVEMFVTKKDELLVNELAPRPHNSGHWTIDACATSQFQQTIRAICGLPLGAADALVPAHMLNLIGDEVKDWEKYLKQPNARLHLYGKKEARPGRKMGHVTFLQTGHAAISEDTI